VYRHWQDGILRRMLRRSLGLWNATAMVVGIIIGASIFVQPSEVSRHVSNIPAIFAVWIAAGVLSLLGALVCADLARTYPVTGGIYAWLRETLSEPIAFLWAWAMFWIAHSGIVAATSSVFARYVAVFAPLSETGMRAVAVAAILTITAINCVGVRAGSGVQTVLTGAKIAAIVAILTAVVFLAPASGPVSQPGAAAGVTGFVLAMSAGLYAYGGWHMVTYAAGETRDAEKNIPRALVMGMLIVTVCYIGLNAAYLHVLPLDKVLESKHVAADAADALLGPRGARVISAFVIVSALGGLSGSVLAGPRVYYAAAQDGLAPRALGAAHPKFQTPHVALIAQAIVASVLVATGTYQQLFTRVIYTEWLFFGLTAIGLMRIRKRITPGPAIFAAGCAMVVINQVIANPPSTAIGLGIVALGWPVYLLIKKYAHH
jgi:APA family basic amino acid/polyamine antiporter